MILWIRSYSSISLMKSKWKTLSWILTRTTLSTLKLPVATLGSAEHEVKRGNYIALLIFSKYLCKTQLVIKTYFFVSSFVFDSVSTTENEIMNINTVLYEDCETESVDSSHTINNNIRCVCAIVDIAMLSWFVLFAPFPFNRNFRYGWLCCLSLKSR